MEKKVFGISEKNMARIVHIFLVFILGVLLINMGEIFFENNKHGWGDFEICGVLKISLLYCMVLNPSILNVKIYIVVKQFYALLI